MKIEDMTIKEARELKKILADELTEHLRDIAGIFEERMGIKFDAVIEIHPDDVIDEQGETISSRYTVDTIVHFEGEEI